MRLRAAERLMLLWLLAAVSWGAAWLLLEALVYAFRLLFP